MDASSRTRGPGGSAAHAPLAILGVLGIIAIWALAARMLQKDLLLPGPLPVARELLRLLPDPAFRASVAATFLRGLAAFGISLLAGSAVGFAAGRSPHFAALISPILTVIRATPVLALILLTLLWFPAGFVPIFAAFLMAFPVMAANAAQGAQAAPSALLEMASLFAVPPGSVRRHIRLPSALPHFAAGGRASLGLCWKVVVAGEVLAQPRFAIGTGMQSSRILLETPTVFAWALAAILLCGLSEGLLAWALARWVPRAE